MLKRKVSSSEVEEEHQDRWLVSYADFITLLFAFFVVMYATSNNNYEKQKIFEQSLQSNLKLNQTNQTNEFLAEGNEKKKIEISEEMRKALLSDSSLEALFNKQSGEKSEQLRQEILKQIPEEWRKSETVTLRQDPEGLRIGLSASIVFMQGSSKLEREALPILDHVAKLLKQNQHALVIEGHTDKDPFIDSNGNSNWELASLRATTVLRYLNKVHEVSEKRMSVASYADQRPRALGESLEAKQKNRRIEILIKK